MKGWLIKSTMMNNVNMMRMNVQTLITNMEW